jgi:hypothetical protein
MKGLREIIRDNARAGGREGYSFVVHIDADPASVREFYGARPDADAGALLAGELETWLESLPYVNRYAVRRRV